jgi:hypothetical protein
VEHPCYRCQTDIPEGTAFCPHCGAPQIRVAPPEGEPEQVPTPAPDAPGYTTSASVPPPPPPPTPWTQGTTAQAPPQSAIQWNLAWKGAMLCGIGAAVLTAIPFVSLGCCLWMLGAGVMCVNLYRRQVPGTVITPGMGMRLGALSGAIGFVVNAIVTTAAFVGRRGSGEFQQAMQEQMKKQMGNTPDPKVQEMMQRMVGWMSTPQGAATMILLVLLIMGMVFVLFTAAGGALGASMTGSRREFR